MRTLCRVRHPGFCRRVSQNCRQTPPLVSPCSASVGVRITMDRPAQSSVSGRHQCPRSDQPIRFGGDPDLHGPVGRGNGLYANDKFCWSRHAHLTLTWTRRPRRSCLASIPHQMYSPRTGAHETGARRGASHETTLAPGEERRQTTPSPSGQRRWNQAYQLLLEGTDPPRALAAVHLEALLEADQEEQEEYCPVCERFDPATSPAADQ